MISQPTLNRPVEPAFDSTDIMLAGQDLSRREATVLRLLGSFEEFFWLIDQNRPLHFALAAQVQGPTTVRGWRRALRVQRRHPLLSVCIEQNGDCHPHFRREIEAPIPLRVVQGRNAIQIWQSEMELELSIPFDPRHAPLMRAVLLHEAQRAVIILVAHHSIADGRSIAFVIRDLLQAVSGIPFGLLPVLPAHEEILGLTRPDAVAAEPSNESNVVVKPATYLRKEDSRPCIKGLLLTPELTGKLRERVRREGTSVHGALSAALALASWQIGSELSPMRVVSPIDTRKLLGLGEDCAVLIDAGVVPIEPYALVKFWEVARHAAQGLAGPRSLEGVLASRNALHRTVSAGIDVSAAAAICAHAFAHDLMLTNLGNIPYAIQFGALKLETVWGPSVSARFQGVPTIGVATTNGALSLLETRFAPSESLLETTEQILLSACAV
jgi:hypothetical protein